MAKKKTVTVMGLDLAAVNSGVCIITATPLSKAPHVSHAVLFEKGIVHGPKNDAATKAAAADMIKGLCVLHKVDFVTMEDYAARIGPTNTSAYQYGEMVGMVKKGLVELGIPYMTVGPTSMRSFISVPSRLPDSGKQYIIDWCREEYGFVSEERSQNRRSNSSDAFCHAIIASTVYWLAKREDLGELDKSRNDVLYGDEKKMEGLLRSPQFFYNCDWMTHYLTNSSAERILKSEENLEKINDEEN